MYNPDTRLLEVRVGAIEKGQEKTIVIFGTVAANTHGKDIHNVAIATSENADKVQVEADIVGIAPGESDGNTITKAPNKTIAKPGETVTYTITARNHKSVTAPWEMTISDPIPEGMTFTGNVTLDGKATTDYSYNAEKRTLTLMPQPIKPGEWVKFTFDVTIDEGTEGKSFTNIAVMDDGKHKQEVPSVPVDVPLEPAKPHITKVANKTEVKDLEELTYKVTVHNDKSGEIWRRVLVTDHLPKEVMLVNGPYVNGEFDNDYIDDGNGAITVNLQDVEPGETVEITYNVQVRKGTQKTVYVNDTDPQEKIDKLIHDNTVTLTNTVSAIGQNGSGAAQDSNVKVPPIVEKEEGAVPPELTVPELPFVKKISEKTLVDLSTDPDNWYTIVLENPAKNDKVWEDVVVTDVLNINMLHFYGDSLTVDGIPKTIYKDFQYNANKDTLKDTLKIPIGDIKPGEKVEVRFKVRFNNDKNKNEYVNVAAASSSNYKDFFGEAPIVVRSNPLPFSSQHGVLFVGLDKTGDWGWWPYATPAQPHKMLTTHELATVVFRSITPEQRGLLLGGRSPSDAYFKDKLEGFPRNSWFSECTDFMGALGALTAQEVDFKHKNNVDGVHYLSFTNSSGEINRRMIATREQIGRVLDACGLGPYKPIRDYSDTDLTHKTNRLDFATDLCIMFYRDQGPDTHGCHVNRWNDDENNDVIKEVSIAHGYVWMGENGDEMWTWSDPSMTWPGGYK